MLTYKYRPLGDFEFRLLKIVKGAQDDLPGYSIVHANLNDPPNYEAISYVWGSSQLSHTLQLIDGSVLSVTAALTKALPFLTRASHTGYLWVDQITIDQANTIERSDQVKIMGEIYSRCARCLVWFDHDPFQDVEHGRGVDWSQGIVEDVLEFFQSFNNEETVNEWQTSSNLDLRRTPIVSITSPSRPRTVPRDSTVKDHLQWFFEHPWFKRVWVYQEFVLAPRSSFLIGNSELSADEIERVFVPLRLATWFNTLHHRLGVNKMHAALLHKAPGFEFLNGAIQSRQLYTDPKEPGAKTSSSTNRSHIDGFRFYESMTFADMLDKMGGSHASDQRDHVYAFIGLAPCLLKYMTVDYSLPVEQAFAAMMKALISETKSLDFWMSLPCEHDVSKSSLRLPSWVPNWTFYSENPRLLSHDNLFNACGPGYGLPSVGKCKHFDVPTSAWNELMVAGKTVDVVQLILRPYSAYQVNPSMGIEFQDYPGNLPWDKATLSLFLAELKERSAAESGRVSMKALLRTLLMDGVQWAAIDAYTAGTSLYRTAVEVFDAPHHKKVDDTISVLMRSDKVDPGELPYGATLQTLHALSIVQYNKRVAYCTNGRLAMVPDSVEAGDRVAILHGSRAPVLLRPCRDGKHKVVGQCYYDGAMYGEMADEDDDAAQVLTLI